MNNQSSWAKSAAPLCLEFGEEDGIDPRILARKTVRKSSRHKDRQLGKEAGRIIALVLADAVNHPLLCDLQVLAVAPELDGKRLCVTVAHVGVNIDVTETEVVAGLKQIQGVLRCALAQAINRKQVPVLNFRYGGLIDHVDAIHQGGG
jgi:ribosome-binding factor A